MKTQCVGLHVAVPGEGDSGQTGWLWAAGSPGGAEEGQAPPYPGPTLAGGAAVPRRGERAAAAERLAGPAAAGHEASEAGAQVAGLSGVWELLAAQVGLPEIFTALRRGQREAGRDRKRERTAVTASELAPGLNPRQPGPGPGVGSAQSRLVGEGVESCPSRTGQRVNVPPFGLQNNLPGHLRGKPTWNPCRGEILGRPLPAQKARIFPT